MTPFEQPIADPMQVFRAWMAEAEISEPNDPNAAALATASKDAIPSVRMVLTKGADERGIRFFTNSGSQKGRELEANPVAALVLHWKTLRRQVRFQGEVRHLESGEVDTYFHSRSRRSQIAAAVSKQSQPLASREALDVSVRAFTEKLEDETVPLPTYWVGFLLVPRVVEFWADGPDRLHDRMQYLKNEDGGWATQRLYP